MWVPDLNATRTKMHLTPISLLLGNRFIKPCKLLNLLYSYASFFDILAIEPTIPRSIPLEEKRSMYQWSDGTDKYPPHLAVIPDKDNVHIFKIFNALGLIQTGALLKKLVPSDDFLGRIGRKIWEARRKLVGISSMPYAGTTIAEIEERNRHNRKTGTDVMRGQNIGDLSDWYSDARFAQQYLTGANPTTITLASDEWLAKFINAAEKQNPKAVDLFRTAGPKSFYIQDYSYFRDAIKASADYEMVAEGSEGKRWSCASVSLFQLHPDGRLHPLAIVIDYKGSMDNSVTIFNKRLHPSDSTDSEKTDWPWRYAKTCTQVSDWTCHELAVHLTDTHMIEEVIIVATNRHMDSQHPVYRLLKPHWLKTLSLNAAARETLVPQIIFDLVGMKEDEPFNFLSHAFKKFDFVSRYVPNDLASRGFPLDALDEAKFKNYSYAKNMNLMWKVLRSFVASMLAITYPTDTAVVKDDTIRDWCNEIQSAGQLSSFPTITTRDQLIDAVTMCIHIASPQHTAVNYLQNFYMAFVIAKPPALCQAPPNTLSELQKYTENHLVYSLPVNRQREWLLAAQVPWLLSFRVTQENSLINYADSLWRLYKYKMDGDGPKIKAIANKLYDDLRELITVFAHHSKQMTEGTIPYMVMDPNSTAISILI